MATTRTVKIGPVEIGGSDLVVIAGPCSIESQQHLQDVATAVKSRGATILRGGIYKLRTQPDSFQGLGHDALKMVTEVRRQLDIPLISEVTDPRQISDMVDAVDAFQVGSRNMHNYELLKELGRTRLPVMLKRGFSGLIKEWLHAADYILQGGNEAVILCERGIRTFETTTRNTFDLNAVAWIRQNTPFPIVADPSHATGDSNLVTPMALAAAASGAHALMVEVHPEPIKALSDGFQALNYSQFEDLMNRLDRLMPALGRNLKVKI